MRGLPVVLAVLLVLIQYPLWRLDRGGWLHVWEMERRLTVQKQHNDALSARNVALAAEVRDLQDGLVAVEERARYGLGMIGEDEVFIQINVPVKQPRRPGPDGTNGERKTAWR